MSMSDKEFANEQGLRDIYYAPKTGYRSAEKLYQKAKEDGLKVSRKLVKEWLITQNTYTRFKPVIRKHKFRKTFVKNLADQMQMDLADMGKYANKNKGYRWILTAVEILSRYAFAIPVYRKWNFYKYKLLLMDDTERTRLEGHRLRYHVKRIRKLLLSKQGKTLTKTSTICLPNP